MGSTFALPALHGHWVFGSLRDSLATGWLFSVITNSSPGERLWIRSDSRLLASSMEMVVMRVSLVFRVAFLNRPLFLVTGP